MSLTTEQIENLIEENNQKLRAELLPMASDAKPRTGMINCVSELKYGNRFYTLGYDGVIRARAFNSDVEQQLRIINQGNAAWDEATLERKAKLNELNTRARAASAKAGVIDWNDDNQSKCRVFWSNTGNSWMIGREYVTSQAGVIYFPSKESAENFMQSLTQNEQRLFAGGDL